mmetsp:Transcript_47133/g.89986  ORF Transcript_47133/g.89986 Transcript_47133/m.89986 type:complete len:249 (-) Transcript_47133:332-1078(-)
MSAPMLLDSLAHGDAPPLGRWGTDARIDALPYGDALPSDWRTTAEQLIKEEMRRSSKSVQDYLEDLPPMPPTRFPEDSLVGAELARVSAGLPMPPMDQTRFRLEPPPLNRRNDGNAWKSALNNASAQLEHQALRMTNLELLFRYGTNAWKANLNHLEATATNSEVRLLEIKAKVDSINQERKLHQEHAGKEIRELEEEWKTLVQKNMDIAAECKRIEEELASLRDEEDSATKAVTRTEQTSEDSVMEA